MNSDRSTAGTSRSGGGNTSATPSIALLNRRLGTSPAPRMLTPYEIDLLRQCVKEVAEVTAPIKIREFTFTHTSGCVPRHTVLGLSN